MPKLVKVKVKVKQSHYRPGQAQRILRKLRFPDFVTTAQDGGRLPALRTGRLYPQEILLVLISVRGWVDPRAIVRSERFCANEKSTDTSWDFFLLSLPFVISTYINHWYLGLTFVFVRWPFSIMCVYILCFYLTVGDGTYVVIEPATVRYVTQHLNHCATAVPARAAGI